MAIESPQILRLVQATNQDRSNFISNMAEHLGQPELERIKADFLTAAAGMYLVMDPFNALSQGYVLVKPYDRLDHAVEIQPWLDLTLAGSASYREVLRETVNTISEDPSVEYVVLKIEDRKVELVQTAISIGFMKEGIYISNQFLQGEFSFYSVYVYKLS